MSYKNNLDPIDALSNAIIIQAAKDYRAACVKLKNPRSRNREEFERVRSECLRFFNSQWFTYLTRVEPEYLIERLDEEVMA